MPVPGARVLVVSLRVTGYTRTLLELTWIQYIGALGYDLQYINILNRSFDSKKKSEN